MATKHAKMTQRPSTLDDLIASGVRYQPLEDPTQAQPEQPSSLTRRILGDGGISLLKGAVGVPEAAVGLADLVSGGRVGRALEQGVDVGGVNIGFRPKMAKEALDQMLTPEQQKANQEVQQAQGFLDTTLAALRNPSTILHAAAESMPMMGAGGVVGRALMAGTRAAAPGLVASKYAPVLAGAAGEGITTMGSQAESIRQETPDGLVTGQQAGLAAGSGFITVGWSVLGGAVAAKLGIHDIDTLLAGKHSDAVTKGFTRRVLEGAVSEGLLEELPQSVQEQVAQNLALGKPVGEGVNQAAVLGMFSGGLMGGVSNMPGHGKAKSPASSIRDEKLAPTGPVAKAINAGIEDTAQQAEAIQAAAAQPVPVQPVPAQPVDQPMPALAAAVAPVQDAAPAEAAPAANLGAFEQRQADKPAEPAAEPLPGEKVLKTMDAAMRVKARAGDGAEIVPVAGGVVVRKVDAETGELVPAAAPAAAPELPGVEAAPPAPPPAAALPDDVLAPHGKPFTHRGAAATKMRKLGKDFTIAEVEGGFAVRKLASATQPEWAAFPPESGTKGVPRADMPQIKAGDRSALVQFLRARGVDYSADEEVPAASLKATQAEYSPKKVQQAREYQGGDRSILVSSDGHVVDGHHQWMAKLQAGEPVKAIRLNAPIEQLLPMVKEFPSAEAAASAKPDAASTNPLKRAGDGLPPTDLERVLAKLKPAERDDPEVREFAQVADAVGRAEIDATADEWTPEQRALHDAGDWRGFSKLRGYSDAEIQQFDRFMALAKSLDGRYGDGFSQSLSFGVSEAATAADQVPSKQQPVVAPEVSAPEPAPEQMTSKKAAPSEPPPSVEPSPAKQLRQSGSSANTPTATPAPQPAAAPTAEARWGVFMPMEREKALIDAGWHKGSPGTEAMKTKAWDQLTTNQKARISKAMESQAAPAALSREERGRILAEFDAAPRGSTLEYKGGTYEKVTSNTWRMQGTNGTALASSFFVDHGVTSTESLPTAAPTPAPKAEKAEVRPFRREDGSIGYEAVPIASPAPAAEPAAPAAPATAAPAAPAVSANTIFTEDAAAKAREVLKRKLGNLNTGIDPEILQAGITLAGYHIEKGARTFAAYARAMVSDLGDGIKPYLQSWYMAVRSDPRAAEFKASMDKASAIEDLTADEIDALLSNSGTPQAAEPAQNDATKEKPDDPAASGPAPTVDQPLVEGPAPNDVRRGAKQPRQRVGRRDDPGVRGQGGLFESPADEGAPVGDRGKSDPVPAGADGNLAGRVPGVPTRDYRPAPGSLKREGSWFATAARNIDLIDLARRIESEGRQATPEEQAQLAKYVGFGASEIRNNLFPVPQAWQKQQDPKRLIWPDLVREARWKPLAERMAALPEEWQRSVLQSTQYAHYTSENVIRSVWSGLQRLGFTGGKMLEPGMGIGSFNMLMPDSVHATSRYTGVEFDGPTALIARLLSPDQNMLHEDFIKRKFPRDFFDLAIGNPPFSQTKVLADPDYEKHGFMLHDFFFAKSIDRVRPGGLLVFVTSKGTMDKQNDKARKYLAERADLLGAVRLPSTAFEDNAGTSVVTDVIFLRKRAEGQAPAGPAWQGVQTIDTKDGPAVVNEYFAANPDMVLGEQRISGNVDDFGRRINSNGMGGAKYTVVSYDSTAEQLDERFAKAIERLPENVYSALRMDSTQLKRETAKVDFDPSVKREGVAYVGKDGTLMRVQNGVGVGLGDHVKLSAKDEAWFKGYVGVRDLVQAARLAQVQDGDWEKALKALNKAYDAFRKEHGPVNDFRTQTRKSTDEDGNEVSTEIRIFKNRRLFREDYDNAVMTQLEVINEAGEITKAPFLLGRTIGKPVVREVKTVGDALAVSLDETGRLDLDDIARRMGISRDDAIEALGSQVFKAPSGQWQLADEYLSGDVVAKLEEAEIAARLDESLKRNVEALKAVQPEKLGPSQISVKAGASWVPVEFVNEFAKEIGAGRVTFDAKTESWQVQGGNERSGRRAGAEYGTADRSASELLESVLNSQSITIKRTGADKKTVTDPEATTAANEMARKIKDKFKGWIWTDTDRATTLVEIYNKRFNNIAPRRFDGSHMTLPGVSLRFSLHPHQKRAIWRQVQTGNTYLAHAVGAGKTIEMIAGGMEQKRLGLINKPIYAVPNHMLEQFANEFMELYPLANIMVADDENFSAERRKAFVAAATLNAPDAIIITHSAFERIGIKEETVAPIRDEILLDLQAELDDAKSDRVRRSQLQQQIEAVEQRFDSIAGVGKKDSTIKFEDIGADFVYVDEAHAYRKLDFTTNQKIKGIDPNGSRRALDMYVKTRHLEKQRPGRAMVFASGTPVTNTMGELYTIMRFFAPEELNRAGISTFDAWARQFGEAVPALEANAAGRYEVVERFAKFDNVPELMSRVRQFMDVLTSEHLGALVKRPDIEGGKPDLITVEPTEALKRYMKTELLPRLEKSRRWKPSKDEPFNPDPVIAITSDGRFAALDPRFFGEQIDEDKTPTKMTRMADEVARIYHASADNVYFADKEKTKPEPIKGSTQIVFYNLGFGQQSTKNRGFDARAALNRRLMAQGVKREHILWFDDADTDAKKEAAFKAMRNGQARILIGSAKKMGTGVNVQKRLLALHYFDPPWYPSDVEQPHGRIIRQGNQNPLATIKWYATKGTYDSTMWQMVGRKQRFIDQAFSGDKSLRSMEDMSEASMFEQAAAVASGDPRALQLAGLRQDVERLERLQAAHSSEQVAVKSALRSAEWNIEAYQKRIQTYAEAFKAIGGGYYAFSSAQVDGRTFDKVGEFGQALKLAFNEKAAQAVMEPDTKTRELATLPPGITIRMESDEGKDGKPNGLHELVLRAGAMDITLAGAAPSYGEQVDAVGLGRRVVNAINGIEQNLNRAKASLIHEETDATRLRKKLGAPFEYTQELAEKIGDLKRLEEELRAEGEADAKAAAAAANPVAIDENGIAEGDPTEDGEDFAPKLSIDDGGLAAQTANHGTPSTDDRRAVELLQAGLRRHGRPDLVLDAVSAGSGAPGSELPGRDGRARQAAADVAARLFGKRLTFFTSNVPLAAGAYSTSQPDRLFLARDNAHPIMAVTGHEMLHAMRKDRPDLYDALRDAIRKNSADVEQAGLLLRLKYRKLGLNAPTADTLEEEFLADVVGDRWTEPEFWSLMSQGQPQGLRKVLAAIVHWLDALLDKIRNTRPFNTAVYLTDIKAARQAVADALRNYSAGEVGTVADPGGIAFSRAAAPGQRLDLASAQRLADGLAAGGLARINVVGSVADLPAQPKQWITAKAPDGRVRGAYLKGTDQVWMFTDNIATPDEFVFVALHEAFHRGLHKVIPESGALLTQMYRSNKALRAATDEQMRVHKIGQLEAIEEALADMAGAGTARDLSGWDKLLQVVRDWLGKLAKAAGVQMTWTDDMVADFVAGIRAEGLKGGVHVSAAVSSERPEEAMLSRSFKGMLNDAREINLPSQYKVGDFFNADGQVHWWHKTVGTMHNLAERSPLFKRVYDAVQNFVGDVSNYATEAADLAPRILPKLEHWKDILKSPIKPEDAKAIAAPIFEGTLNWMRDAQGQPVKVADVQTEASRMSAEEKARAMLKAGKLDERVLKMWQGLPLDQFESAVETRYANQMLKGGIVWSDAELRARFNLSTEQIGLYREFRAAVDKSVDSMAVSHMLRFAGEDAAPVRRRVLAMGNAERASEVLRDYLFAMAEGDAERRDVLNDTANKVVDIAAHAKDLAARGYAPLSRFGQHTLDVVDSDGERVYFGLFESAAERTRMARQMRAEYPAATITTGTTSQEAYRLFAGVGPETLELFGEFMGLENQGSDEASKAFQQYIKLTKSTRSAMRRMIERKGIAGFSEDAGRVLAGFVYSNARQTASNLHMGEMSQAAAEIPKGEGQLQDAAVKLVEYVKNPQEEAQTLRGWLFAQYLGGSVASALVNMTQPATVTLPYLSQFGGAAKAAKRVAAAARLASKASTGNDMLDRALRHAEDEGIVAPQEVHQLQAQAMGRGSLRVGDGTTMGNLTAKGMNKLALLGFAWGKLFGMAEQVNRRITFIAAYNTALAEGMADPAGFAAKAVTETQFTYNKGNKPRWARGAIGSVAFTFKQYSISYLELLNRMWNTGEEGSPERRAGRKAVLLALAVLMLAGGADGLPFMQDAEDIIDGLLQRLGFNFSTKQSRREFLVRALGDGGAEFVSKGLSGLPGAPIDVSGRMGMGNLIPGTGLLTKKTDYSKDVAEFAGPAADLATRAMKAAGQVVDGDVKSAAATILPTAGQNLVKAFDMAKTGMYRDDKGRKVLDVDGYDTVAKALGFQPHDVAKVQDSTSMVQRMVAQTKIREAEIASAWAQGIFEKDPEKIQEARDALARWNENNPAARIRIDMPQILKRVRAMNQSKTERIAKTAPKEMRGQVRAALAEGAE